MPKSVEHFSFAIGVAPWGKVAVQQKGQFRLRPHKGTRRPTHATYTASMDISVIDRRGDDFAWLRKRAFPCDDPPT